MKQKNSVRVQNYLYAIGGKLRGVRKSIGNTPEEVERFTGIPKSTLTRIERGENAPNAIHIIQLCGLYNLAVEDLFEGLIIY